MDIHASTQMTITGYRGAAFMEGQGISRVVPARELSLEEVRMIKEKTGLEIDVLYMVHFVTVIPVNAF